MTRITVPGDPGVCPRDPALSACPSFGPAGTVQVGRGTFVKLRVNVKLKTKMDPEVRSIVGWPPTHPPGNFLGAVNG